MTLAIISIAREVAGGVEPVSLLPLFDHTVAERQAALAGQAGAEKILFLCNAVHQGIVQLVDRLNQHGMAASIARNRADIAEIADSTGKVLYFGDGIIPGDALLGELAAQSGEAIYVVEHSDENAEYERIDLNHRWSGIAVLRAERLGLLSDIPEDWDAGSALLRSAVQANCHRRIITARELADGAITHFTNHQSLEEYGKKSLKQAFRSKGNFVDRWLVGPVTRRILPVLWRHEGSRLYLGIASGFSAISSTVLAYFQWPAASLILLLAAAILGGSYKNIALFSFAKRRDWLVHPILWLSAAVALGLIVLQQSPPITVTPNLVVLALLLLGLFGLERTKSVGLMRLFQPDMILVIILLLVSALSGLFLSGLYSAALLTGVFLLTFMRSNPSID